MKTDLNFHGVEGGLYLTKEFVSVSKGFVKDEDVEVIFDLGSRDACESLALSKVYPNAKIYAFECNPNMRPVMEMVTSNEPNITWVERAVTNYTGRIKFNVIAESNEDYNPGASSIFQFTEEGRAAEKKPVVWEVDVESVRLDDWMKDNAIPKVDLIWMDLQGAEVRAMEGLGVFLEDVKVIHTEVDLRGYYEGPLLSGGVERWFRERNFKKVYTRPHGEDSFDTDFIFVNNKCTPQA